MLPDEILEPIASAIDFSVCSLAWAHQLLLVISLELGKSTGGFRTIAKTPKVYRLWARERRHPVSVWEQCLDKPYDTASNGSSALLAAAERSMFAEVAHRNHQKCCGTFFDLEKSFGTVEP